MKQCDALLINNAVPGEGEASDIAKPAIKKVAGWAEDFLGKDAQVITNEAGDKVFVNSENTRRVRFDFNNTYPHDNPHVHIEEYIDGRWSKTRVYPKDVNPW